MDGNADQPERPSDLLAQWQQAIETYRANRAQIIQAWSFLAAASVAFLGFGVERNDAGLLYAAAVPPAIMIGTIVDNQRYIIPHVYLAMMLEKRLGVSHLGTMSTLIKLGSVHRGQVLQEIVREADEEKRSTRVARLASPRTTLLGPEPGFLYAFMVVLLAIAFYCDVFLEYTVLDGGQL